MAKWVSDKTAARWNRTADIVDGNGAGNRFVRGLYRPPIRTASCPDIGLAPGSYPAVAGATIAAGASGSVVYDGVIYAAVNQSKCPVAFGDAVGLHVSPGCESFFVPCVCNCESTPPVDCCDKTYAVCIAGTTHLLGIGSVFIKTWSTCCTIEGGGGAVLNLSGYLTCNAITSQIFFNWLIGSGSSGFIELTGLCSGSSTVELDLSEVPGVASPCLVDIVAADELISCDDCSGTPPPSSCCSQSLYFCLNGVSQLLAVSGGNYTWDVSACCDATASLEITLSCNAVTNTISLFYEYTAGEVYAAGTENVIMSRFCDDDSPRIVTFTSSPCFLQMLVSGVEFGCAECTGGATTTEPPPP
jgi:hypothetical protein